MMPAAMASLRFIPSPRSVNLISWTFNPSISLAGIPVVYEIQV